VISSKFAKIPEICFFKESSLCCKFSLVRKLLSASFQPGSQIIPVAPPIKAKYLFALLIKCTQVIKPIKFPKCKLSAVGS
jgi:hypothetical protein